MHYSRSEFSCCCRRRRRSLPTHNVVFHLYTRRHWLSLVLTSWVEIRWNCWSIHARTVSFGLRISASFCGIFYDVYVNSFFEGKAKFWISSKMENSHRLRFSVTAHYFYRFIASLSSDRFLKHILYPLPPFIICLFKKIVKHWKRKTSVLLSSFPVLPGNRYDFQFQLVPTNTLMYFLLCLLISY